MPKEIVIRPGSDYFGDPISVESNIEAAKLINSLPNKHIRIEYKNHRFLFKPEVNGQRQIEGCTSLYTLYELFNDIHNKYSHLGCDEKGPGGLYYSHNPI